MRIYNICQSGLGTTSALARYSGFSRRKRLYELGHGKCSAPCNPSDGALIVDLACLRAGASLYLICDIRRRWDPASPITYGFLRLTEKLTNNVNLLQTFGNISSLFLFD